MRTRVIATFTLLVLLLAVSISGQQVRTSAQAPISAREIIGKNMSVSLIVNGRANGARFFAAPGLPDRKVAGVEVKHRYAELRKGDVFQIFLRLRNVSRGEKIGIGIAVDGLNVIGKRPVGNALGSFILAETWNRSTPAGVGDMYVMSLPEDANGAPIAGWRDDDTSDTVREFVVTMPANSVAGRFGDLSAAGTMVFAFFPDKYPSKAPPIVKRRQRDDGDTSRSIGIGEGRQRESVVDQAQFTPADVASGLIVIKLEERNILQQLGVWVPEVTVSPQNRVWPN